MDRGNVKRFVRFDVRVGGVYVHPGRRIHAARWKFFLGSSRSAGRATEHLFERTGIWK